MVSLSLLHHLLRKHLPALQNNAHHVSTHRQTAHINTLKAAVLRAYQAALQVVELDLLGLNIRGKLYMQLVFYGVGIEAVGANFYAAFVHSDCAVVVEDNIEQA